MKYEIYGREVKPLIMNATIISVSMLFTAYFAYSIIKTKPIKYFLPPVISLLYGFMLFFVGMGISDVLYLLLAVIPVIVSISFIIKQNQIKKS